MVNITVLKYYKVYNSDYVNKFYDMLKSKTTVPFKFWVQTEDPVGLNPEFGILPIDKVDPVVRRWHKLDLFETTLLTGKCFHFDLDMVINKNIDHYLNYEPTKFTMLYSIYKDKKKVEAFNAKAVIKKDSMVNSSIFCWNIGCQSTKEILKKHYSLKFDLYLGSFDNFLYNECRKDISIFPFSDFSHYTKQGFNKEKTFCLFNQAVDHIHQFLP
jgi:hypothetical protein